MWNKKCVFETLSYINKSEEVKYDTKIASIDRGRYAEASHYKMNYQRQI